MSTHRTWAALRKIVGDRHGYRCVYCGVPTAATIEHLTPRSVGGEHDTTNLRLACPYCNALRGNEDMASWRGRRGWVIAPPSVIPGDADQLAGMFRGSPGWSRIDTGSTNATLIREDGQIIARIRPGKGYPWQRIVLGPEGDGRVLRAAWGFLVRHHTPRS